MGLITTVCKGDFISVADLMAWCVENQVRGFHDLHSLAVFTNGQDEIELEFHHDYFVEQQEYYKDIGYVSEIVMQAEVH